jgi:hypothetical protein
MFEDVCTTLEIQKALWYLHTVRKFLKNVWPLS